MEVFPAGTSDHMSVKARVDRPKTRQPIVGSNMPVLTPSPIMAEKPLCRGQAGGAYGLACRCGSPTGRFRPIADISRWHYLGAVRFT